MTIYQVTFFILFTTIGLNVIFGIIVDTFSELRDLKVCDIISKQLSIDYIFKIVGGFLINHSKRRCIVYIQVSNVSFRLDSIFQQKINRYKHIVK